MEIKIDIESKALMDALEKQVITNRLKWQFNKRIDKLMSPYVPWKEGFLDRKNKKVTANGIEYNSVYARYQYYLHNMGADLAGVTNRTRTKHKRPTSFWDKAFMMEQGSNMEAQLQQILDKHIRSLNNGS